jgi:O-antigen ligase
VRVPFTKNYCPIQIGQSLIFLSLIGVITSPPIANTFLVLTTIWVLSFKELRIRLWVFLNSTTGYFLASFIIILIIGLTYSSGTNSEKLHEIWGWRKVLALPLAASLFINSPDGKNKFLKRFFIFCWVCCLISLGLFLLGKSGIIFRNYVTQGLIFSIASLISVHFFSKKDTTNIHKILLGFGFALFLGNILFISISRSGYLAFFAMITFFALLHNSLTLVKKIKYLSIFTATTTLLFYLNPITSNRISLANEEFKSGVLTSQATSVGFRITFLKHTLPIIEKDPLFGVGTGGFKNSYSKQVSGLPFPENQLTADPHNQYLKIWAENGIVGLFIFLALLISISRQKSNYSSKIIGGITLISWCLTSLTNSHFATFNEGQFIWLWLGIFFASDKLIYQTKS